MAIQITVEAEARTETGKGPARRVRREGKIPATLYGAARDPQSLIVSPKQMAQILHSHAGHNTIFNLAMGAETTAAMIVDWQREPVKGNLLHVDLKRIAMDQLLHVKVPVHTRGEAVGVKLQGGILEVVTREVELECLPDAIPEDITVDISGLNIGQNVRAVDLQLGAGRKLLTEADRVILHVVAVKEVAVPVAEAAAAPAEPEVAKKGKTEGDEKEKEKEKK